MKRILVTGGAGFIGSHLCNVLIERGDSVVCVDNFLTGQKENISHLLDNDRFELIEHDIVQPLENIDVDQVYNLACPASPIHYQYNPIKTVKTSTIGMINMLGLAKKAGARILQASTSEVYGDPEVHPQTEQYRGNVNTVGPRACYDEGKRVSETLCMDYHREHGLEVRIIRIFNTYGPNMHPQDGRVISNFINQAITNEPITIYGTGSQTRSFCYVDDLVRGIIAMMDNDSFTGPVNLGNPVERTMTEMANIIRKMTNSTSDIVHKALPEDDPRQRQPDISLAKEKLQWTPTIPLEEGLTKTIQYFQSKAA